MESDLAEPRVALTYDLDEHVCLFVNWFAEYISDFFDLHVALSVAAAAAAAAEQVFTRVRLQHVFRYLGNVL